MPIPTTRHPFLTETGSINRAELIRAAHRHARHQRNITIVVEARIRFGRLSLTDCEAVYAKAAAGVDVAALNIHPAFSYANEFSKALAEQWRVAKAQQRDARFVSAAAAARRPSPMFFQQAAE